MVVLLAASQMGGEIGCDSVRTLASRCCCNTNKRQEESSLASIYVMSKSQPLSVCMSTACHAVLYGSGRAAHLLQVCLRLPSSLTLTLMLTMSLMLCLRLLYSLLLLLLVMSGRRCLLSMMMRSAAG